MSSVISGPTPLRKAHILEAGDIAQMTRHKSGIPALAGTGSEVGGHLWPYSKFETSLFNNINHVHSTAPYPIVVQEKAELCVGVLGVKAICVGIKVSTLSVLLSNSQLQNRHWLPLKALPSQHCGVYIVS